MSSHCCGASVPAPEAGIAPCPTPGEEKSTKSCKNSCCDGDKAGPVNDAALPQVQEELIQKGTVDSCSPEKCADVETNDDGSAPECCRGKTSPCCDASCIERLAMRECASNVDCGPSCHPNMEASDRKLCDKHTLSALDRWGATLQALGCLCRSLIALGEETCCEVRERHSPTGKRVSPASSANSLLRVSLDSLGSSRSSVKEKKNVHDPHFLGNFASARNSSNKKQPVDACSGSCPEDKPTAKAPAKCGSSKTCCSKSKSAKIPSPNSNHAGSGCTKTVDCDQFAAEPGFPKSHSLTGHSKDDEATCDFVNPDSLKTKFTAGAPGSSCAVTCCGDEKEKAKTEPLLTADPCSNSFNLDILQAPKTSCAGSCCPEVRPVQASRADACCSSTVPAPGLQAEKAPVQEITDIENQGTSKEYVVLSISGMTCTGCETKLKRTLDSVPAVEDLKTSLVLSRAEFNVNHRLSSVEQVMKHLERTTEFKCERVQNNGSTLDLIVPDGPSTLVDHAWPKGVIEIIPVDKQAVRVVFDPKVIGARDLTEKIWGPPIQLAPPRGDLSLEAGSRHVRHVGYVTFISTVLTIPVLVMAWAPLPEREVAYSSASLALATIVQVVIAGPFYPKALKSLVFSRIVEMDLLIVLSTSAAYVFSVVSFGYLMSNKPLSTGQFFETSTLLVTLIMVGRWVAALARQRAVESISIRSLQTSTAILVDEKSGREREIDVRLLQYGDIFKVLSDSKIPTDGTVITGSSEVDESMLTGEARPVDKYPGSTVIAGSVNGPGVMTIRLNRLPGENTINMIAAMVDEAKLSKPKLQDLADRVAAYFVPIIIALTIITFVVWVAIGMTVRGYGGSEATIQAITYAITVLIVSCPCAIGLAVPIVVVISSGIAAERGIIFKSASAIETAHNTAHVVFDKTGTLTRGKLSVIAQACVDEDKLPILLGLIENNKHPVSISVAAYLKGAGVIASKVPDPKSLTGKGVEAMRHGQNLRAGNSRWLNFSEHEIVQPMLSQGHTVFCFAIDNEFVAVFALEDELRSDAISTVENLKARGVSVHLISGDDDGAVQTLAAKLSIPGSNVRSRSSPADKKDYIEELLADGTGRKEQVVMFCGDGTNDAVALAQATIGVHMNEGTDVAQSAADVVLMRPSLAGILTIMNASQAAVNRIKFNFIWSFVYNTFAVLLAAGAFVNARIPPKFAGLGELVSVLPVIAAAVLLRWSKI